MRTSPLFLALFRFLLPPTIISLLYLYLYPAANGCSFPLEKHGEAACFIPGQERPAIAGKVAPFRLLVLADPQLEGDTSLPDPDAPIFPSFERLGDELKGRGLRERLSGLREASHDAVVEDLPRVFHGYWKRLDLVGNDYYLAHIYRSLSWWTDPTHMVVLGDLLGSQWIGDEEFERRASRFWKRVFNGTEMVPKNVTGVSARTEVLGKDDAWKRRLIAVVGNHDIGYAGDLDSRRIERFEQTFGDVNWDIRFRLDEEPESTAASIPQTSLFGDAQLPPELHLVILNSMNLDEPAYDDELRQQSLDFLDEAIVTPYSPPHSKTGTVLLTHIPLHKEAGVCVDLPYFSYFPPDQGGGIKEQNHLSQATSEKILDGLTASSPGHNAIILNGHDHEGCYVHHHCSSPANTRANEEFPDPDESWNAISSFTVQPEIVQAPTTVREITVRSMMGSYGGNAGLLSAWFDSEEERWRFEYTTCPLGVQHLWWGVHILALIELGLGLGWMVAFVLEFDRLEYRYSRMLANEAKSRK